MTEQSTDTETTEVDPTLDPAEDSDSGLDSDPGLDSGTELDSDPASDSGTELDSDLGSDSGSDPDAAAEPGSQASLLEREGDIAADYLEVLLDIADLDGDIDIDVEADRAAVSIIGTGLDRLVGPGGSTLDALQELTRLAVYRETGVRSRLMLDVGGHRARRREELAQIGQDAAQRVLDKGEAERLAPMTPFERKVVHDAIAAIDGVLTESEGEEPERRIVISPA